MRTTKCGFNYLSKKEILLHRRNCDSCRVEIHIGTRRATNGWEARCGVKFLIRAHLKRHHQACEECTVLKKKNIVARQIKHNQRPEQRAIASKTAKITSARPEIKYARYLNLEKWAKANPEQHRNNLLKGLVSIKNKSKMENWLRESGTLTWSDGKISCANSRLKIVDFVKDKIWIEIDGFYHFFDPKHTFLEKGITSLERCYQADERLKNEALKRGDVMLLRFSMECFVAYSGRMKDECITWMNQMIQNPKPGIWCVGKLYESTPWTKDKCTILKLPIQNIISS